MSLYQRKVNLVLNNMIEIKLQDGRTAYDAVGEYIRRYWNHNIKDTVIVSIGTSYDGKAYDLRKEVASPINFDGVEFLYDWWEGEKFIKLFGIRAVIDLDIAGGIYMQE